MWAIALLFNKQNVRPRIEQNKAQAPVQIDNEPTMIQFIKSWDW